MRIQLTILLLFLTLSCFGQNWQFLNSIAPVLGLKDSVTTQLFKISIDSSDFALGDSIYYLHTNSRTGGGMICCTLWSGCQYRRNSTPVGLKVQFDGTGSTTVTANDGLKFQFETRSNVGDTNLFHLDTLNTYYLVTEAVLTQTFLGITESVKSFKLILSDTLGAWNMSSPLWGKKFKLSKNHGVIESLDLSQWPYEERTYEVQGIASLQLGDFELLREEMYDYQPGDIIQMRESSPYCSITRTKTYLGRQDFADSIIYQVEEREFHYNGSMSACPAPSTIDTVNQVVIKGRLSSEYFPTGTYSEYELWRSVDQCGDTVLRWSNFWSNLNQYCDSCSCWGGKDDDQGWITYTSGYAREEYYYDAVTTSTWTNYLIYSYKANTGASCGALAVGVEDQDFLSPSIFPNPVHDFVNAKGQFDRIKVFDLTGKLMRETQRFPVDVRRFGSGVYLLQVWSGKKTGIATFVKE